MTIDDDDPKQMDIFGKPKKSEPAQVVVVDVEPPPLEVKSDKDDPNNPFDAEIMSDVVSLGWDPWAEMTPQKTDEAEFVEHEEPRVDREDEP
jgi:hypothetical protein